MTLLSNYKPKDGALAKWVREVRRVLLAAEGGVSWADNIGPTVSYEAPWNETNLSVPLEKQPVSVHVLRAKIKGGTSVTSGNTVLWHWQNGTLTVSAIADLTSPHDYEITLGIMGASDAA